MRSTRSFASTLTLAFCALSGFTQQTIPSAAAPPKTVMLPPGVVAGLRISGNTPVYPPIAKAAHISGTVVLLASISPQGKIDKLTVESGPPMLRQAAVDAARTWVYRPYVLNGAPVAVQTRINIVFSLGDALPQGASGVLQASGKGSQSLPAHTKIFTVHLNATPGAAPPPAHPVTAAQVHEMLQLTGAMHLASQFMNAMMPAVQQQMPPYMPQDVLADFRKSFVSANLEDAITRVYQKHLSTEDAAAAIAFYKTPAGQDFLAVQPIMEKEFQEAGRQLAFQTMVDVLQRHKSEIDGAKKEYEASHFWTPPKN